MKDIESLGDLDCLGLVQPNNLMHHITVNRLREAYKELKSQASPGVDGVTWKQYGENLSANLTDLRERVLSGRYRATPSKRVWIPKADGKKRPIGIQSLEDKVVQHVVAWILNQIYEVDFVGFSYGFRPDQSVGAARRLSLLQDAPVKGKGVFYSILSLRTKTSPWAQIVGGTELSR